MARSVRARVFVSLALVMSLAACSQGSSEVSSGEQEEPAVSTSDWSVPQDVLDGLEAEGFACEWSGEGDQIIDRSPISGRPAEVVVIRCDGYGVALGSGEEGWYSMILPECQPLTDTDRNSPLASAPIVLGTNVAFLGGEADATFPDDAPAQDFVTSFGGEILTFLDLYERVCGSE